LVSQHRRIRKSPVLACIGLQHASECGINWDHHVRAGPCTLERNEPDICVQAVRRPSEPTVPLSRLNRRRLRPCSSLQSCRLGLWRLPSRSVPWDITQAIYCQDSVRVRVLLEQRCQIAPGQAGNFHSGQSRVQAKEKHHGRPRRRLSAGQSREKFLRVDLGGFPVVSAKADPKSMAIDRVGAKPDSRPLGPIPPSHSLTCLSTYAFDSSSVNFRRLPTSR